MFFNALLPLILLAPPSGASEKPSAEPRKPNSLAPSLPELTAEEEKKYDAIIDRFMLYDIGQLRGGDGLKALKEFEALGPDSIPALLRGLNRAAEITHSCPVAVIAKKLNRMLGATDDAKLLQFARDEIGAGVSATKHAAIIQDLRLMVTFRRNALLRQQAAASTSGVKPLRSLSISELAEMAGKEGGGPRLKVALEELALRPGDEPIRQLAVFAASYDKNVQQLSRNLLVQSVSRQKPDEIKQSLKHEKAEVRQAAIRAAGARNLPMVGEFLDLLNDDDETVRDVAHQAVVYLARGTDLGPARSATKDDREKAIRNWRTWWTRQGVLK